MPSYTDLGIPASNATVDVSVFDMSSDADRIPAGAFIQPVLPGTENLLLTMYGFFIEHTPTRRRVMFDLGPRKDPQNFAPALTKMLEQEKIQLFVAKDITEQLIENDIPLESIGAVIWRQAFQHPSSRRLTLGELVIGQGTDRRVYPADQNAVLRESDFSGRKVTEVDFNSSKATIGGFRAVDFFRDGSLYLLDVPGHVPGHMAALARVTPTTFLLLGGDTAHHPGEMRPTEALHRYQPCPGELLQATRRTIAPEYFKPTHDDGTFALEHRKEPLLQVVDKGWYHDPESTRASIRKMEEFDANDDVFIMLAHDASLFPLVPTHPAKLNTWKEKGWKRRGVWAFVDEANPAFRFNALQVIKK
ncbi:putative metallo-beta-lactamase superfamily protein [Lyophyllum shimeji]|uniref:Metallo-beta-lactamase superfamily protein n=1 Tax=Lyophyllum shimeji TaxID=47721 RepID=A0A9P3PQ08_LYOSH|nr:putative metallo-beta-lactamase superfamily protein [Lyophyllum shimeji]